MHATERDELRVAIRRAEEQLDSMQVQYRQIKDVEKEQAPRFAALSDIRQVGEQEDEKRFCAFHYTASFPTSGNRIQTF